MLPVFLTNKDVYKTRAETKNSVLEFLYNYTQFVRQILSRRVYNFWVDILLPFHVASHKFFSGEGEFFWRGHFGKEQIWGLQVLTLLCISKKIITVKMEFIRFSEASKNRLRRGQSSCPSPPWLHACHFIRWLYIDQRTNLGDSK